MRQIDSMYRVSRGEIDPLRLEEVKAILTLTTTQHEIFDGSGGVTLELWNEDDGSISFPRAWGARFFGPASDCMVRGDGVDFSFRGDLRPHQVPVVESVLADGEPNGVVVMPCGTGKTVVALRLLASIQKRTLVMVHKEFLLDQWTDRIGDFLGIPPENVGRIQQDRCDFDKPVTIGMIHSLSGEREYPKEMYEAFGCVISDECVGGDSLIPTDKGLIRISEFPLYSPKLVLSFNEALSRWEYRRIIRWIPRGMRKTLEVRAGTIVIRCTPEHLFLTMQGWVEAAALSVGMRILSPVPVGAERSSVDLIPVGGRADSSLGMAFGSGLGDHHGLTGREGGNCSKKRLHSVPVGVVSESICREVSRTQGGSYQSGRGISQATTCVGCREGQSGEKFSASSTVHCLAIRQSVGHMIRRIRGFLSRMAGFSTNGLNIRHPSSLGLASKHEGPSQLASEIGVVSGREPVIRGFRVCLGLLVVRSGSRQNGCETSLRKDGRGGTWMMDQLTGVGFLFILKDFVKRMLKSYVGFFAKWDLIQNRTRRSESIGLQDSGSGIRSGGSKGSAGLHIRAWDTNSLQISEITEGDLHGEPVFDLEVEGNHNFVANGFLVHNCHRMSAPTWRKAIERFPGAVRIGLSATPRRADRLENIFHWHIGPVIARAKGQDMTPIVYRMKVKTVVPNPKRYWRGSGEESRLNLARLVNDLVLMEHRNEKIVRQIVRALEKHRRILLLSDRLEHLDAIEELTRRAMDIKGEDGAAVSVSRYIGGLKSEERRAAAQADLILGTFQMAKEGLDIPELDVLILATPKGDVEQPVGRVLRSMDGKRQPVVLDIVDRIDTIPELNLLSDKRLRIYRQIGCDFPEKNGG